MRVAIVGAGMAGLAAGRSLSNEGHRVVVYEKSRGLGGRAATRRKDGFVWDTGATAIPEEMAPALRSMHAKDLIEIDRPVWLNERLAPRPGDPKKDAPRYAFAAGINTLGKLFAKELDVRLQTRIETVGREGEGYVVDDERFDALILTPPVPQTRVLLESLGEDRALADVEYRPCLSVLLGYETPLPRTPYVALLSPQGAHRLQWVSLESEKCPTRAPEGGSALVCQMSAEFSAAHYDAPLESYLPDVCADLATLFGAAFSKPVVTDLMRWRYSQPIRTIEFDLVNPPGTRVIVAGDGLAGGKLHHARRAGILAAKRLKSL